MRCTVNGDIGIFNKELNIRAAATTNYGTSTTFSIGEINNQTNKITRSLIKFNLSSIPANATITSATMSLWTAADWSSTTRNINVYRLKRPFTETQATWNIAQTGINWQTAGASGANDRETTSIGSVQILANEPLNTQKQISLDPAKIQEFVNGAFTNNGFILIVNTELNDRFDYKSSDNTTVAQRPKLVINYTIPFMTATPTVTPTFTPTSTPTATFTATPTRTSTPTVTATLTPYVWGLGYFPTSNLNRCHIQGVVGVGHAVQAQNASAQWSADTDVSIYYDCSSPQITTKHDNFGNTGWAGYAYICTTDDKCYLDQGFSYDNTYETCEARLNDYSFTDNPNFYTDAEIQVVAMHEIGHCLSLSHSSDTTSIMGAGARGTIPSARDIEIVNERYE